MSDLRVVTLSENTCVKRGLLAEHGLSLLIDYKGYRLLFDTGQGPSVVANARALSIDLKQLNAIALSHGHDDHTGGLLGVLRKTGPIDVYAHPEIFKEKYKSMAHNSYQCCGVPCSLNELTSAGARFKLNTKEVQPTPGLWLTGEIPRITEFEKTGERYFIEADEKYIPDTMLDDQALVAVTAKGPVVITGCAHAGLVNTLHHAAALTNSNHIYALVGGTHLHSASADKLAKTIDALKKFKVQKLAVNHCTGFKTQAELYRVFGDKLIINNTGDILEF
ncbi:MBL fold metallo-hydrolase [Desulfofalx alkaliphila]|uniref:MBL fold metallo-hydrolase n=1 Tax=Desulfofalx alkaliphila TaxID=105483 RepID=UPI0004E17651|nr:MBL fold metallo-hydrolase [Desulfofalx alkaliphila]